MIRCRFALFTFALSLPCSVMAASSVLVWPIFQTIESHEKGSELWLENRGATPVNLQLRVFSWDQKGSSDAYADQRDVVASPPFTTVAPGQRQLVRLMRIAPVTAGKEQSYRIVIDEIPAAEPTAQKEQNSAGLKMRMRYVLPLFTYGQGINPLKNNGSVEAVRTTLRWSLSRQNSRQTLCIGNTGNQHARLSAVYWANAGGKGQIAQANGLLGYVLAQKKSCFPLVGNASVPSGMHLFAKLTDNGQAVEIPADR
ncbi:molecular chaperone [Klebsiella oxytoca]|uniref:fimbrial biogenesis chaperone n=1 Tax=Klebsiella oxytoca TaxID=571 RepID=UPI00280AD93D|nr:molecular chaperone [Klebsiella oxytoca]WMH92002.1 molecular chaperone [Klebsiella oxytoca]HEC2112931.1 molecular chaperone [Klebsiella oxytoca]